MLLPSNEASDYEALVEAVTKEYWPVGMRERALVQSIINTEWRTRRVPMLERGLYEIGKLEFLRTLGRQPAGAYSDELLASVIEEKVAETYKRQFRSLKRQAAELRRFKASDVAELTALQTARRVKRAQPGRTEANSLILVWDSSKKRK